MTSGVMPVSVHNNSSNDDKLHRLGYSCLGASWYINDYGKPLFLKTYMVPILEVKMVKCLLKSTIPLTT